MAQTNIPIPFRSICGSIVPEGGVTLIELLVAILITGVAIAGLGVALGTGYRMWYQAQEVHLCRETGAFAIRRIADSMRGADSCWTVDGGIMCAGPAFTTDSTCRIRKNGTKLYFNDRLLVPLERRDELIRCETFTVTPDPQTAGLFSLKLQLNLRSARNNRSFTFSGGVFVRNTPQVLHDRKK